MERWLDRLGAKILSKWWKSRTTSFTTIILTSSTRACQKASFQTFSTLSWSVIILIRLRRGDWTVLELFRSTILNPGMIRRRGIVHTKVFSKDSISLLRGSGTIVKLAMELSSIYSIDLYMKRISKTRSSTSTLSSTNKQNLHQKRCSDIRKVPSILSHRNASQ